ncbi:MAG: hypothetical protein AAF135_15740 [Bacteroidota bacterium]
MTKNLAVVTLFSFIIGLVIIQGIAGNSEGWPPVGPIVAMSLTGAGLILFLISFLLDIKKSKDIYEWGMILGISCLLAFGIGILTRFGQHHLRKAEAHMLVDRLEAYHEDYGKFPAHLNELTPRYLPFIPENDFGLEQIEFRYQGRKQSFSLEYDSNLGKARYYHALGRWYNIR